jgi:hypothetical protein
LGSLLVILLIEWVFHLKFNNKRKVFTKPTVQVIPMIISLLLVGMWYWYAVTYNNKHNGGVFLTTIKPIWECSKGEMKLYWDQFCTTVLPEFYSKPALIILFSSFIFNLIFIRKSNSFLAFVNVFLFIALVAIFLLWFTNFGVHDYYLVQLLIFPAITWLNTFTILTKMVTSITLPVKVLFSVFIIFNFIYASIVVSIKFFPPKPKKVYSLFLSKETIGKSLYNNWTYNETLEAFESIEVYNRSLGIKREERVISIPDESFNISLYLMDQKGFTFPEFNSNIAAKIRDLVANRKAKFLFINNKDLYRSPDIIPFIQHKIGKYKNIDIYKLDI